MDSVLRLTNDILFLSLEFLIDLLPLFILAIIIAALIIEFVPNEFILKYMGTSSFLNVMGSTFIGALLPLCSCGMIPLAIALRKKGASWLPLISFLTSGTAMSVIALMLTSSLGMTYTVLRFVAVLVFAPIVAVLTVYILQNDLKSIDALSEESCCGSEGSLSPKKNKSKIHRIVKDVKTLLRDYVPALIIAVLLASILGALIPESFVISLLGNDMLLSPLWASLIGVPVYLCAGSEIPLINSLLEKGASIGSVLAIMLAAPNINLTTFFIYGKWLGAKNSFIYLTLNWIVISVISIMISLLYIGYAAFY